MNILRPHQLPFNKGRLMRSRASVMSGGKKNARLGLGEAGEFVEELGLIGFDHPEVIGLFFFDPVSGGGGLSV